VGVQTASAEAEGGLNDAVERLEAVTSSVAEYDQHVNHERSEAEEQLDAVKQALREQLELLEQ
jgi:hypothetical protein